ncbi:MAG TPA: phosphoribosylglycinamide formyltransferase [Gemmatimonadaceae bacterium]|nr:phosphoribosylglycinamide formyltransferase [Gemmatimonadaceae bacterium]
MKTVVFLDRDGTIIRDEHYLADPNRVMLIDGAAEAIARLREAGAVVVVVTNQSGIARGLITPAQYEAVSRKLEELVTVDATYMCPHHPDVDGPCECRKPGLGMYQQAIVDLGLQGARIVLVGDRWTDIAAAEALGGYGILVASADTPREDIARAPVQAPDLGAAVTMALETRIAVFASGAGSNMEAIAEHLPIALVASNKASAGVLAKAHARGIPTAIFANHDDADEILRVLRQHRIELIALAGYLKHVPDAVTRAFRGRILNIHPALLPSFGGPGMYGERVHAAVLEAGVKITGATVHFVDTDYDRGPIIAQAPVWIHPDDTLEGLAARVLEVEHRMYPQAIAAVATGRVTLGADGRVIGDVHQGDPHHSKENDLFAH